MYSDINTEGNHDKVLVKSTEYSSFYPKPLPVFCKTCILLAYIMNQEKRELIVFNPKHKNRRITEDIHLNGVGKDLGSIL